ncbi:hypothetical protein BS78_K306600 [Paspalum vaginatum]|uniref:GDSL esterase/lipase APG n=1 Tax=Paspalum vaginatum TaxID=158149 RepID=A0A9W8CEL8_9POAL|nr:hypothetical protein BS78_K306600 [Paspalum vaginatum]
MGLALAAFLLVSGEAKAQQQQQPVVPALVTFGDSQVDVGNNDYVDNSLIGKANMPPYGRDFKDHVATGRFCNGKLGIDIIAERLGFISYPPAYLSPQASGHNLLIGANFASAGSGFYDDAPFKSQYITLSQQLEYFKEYRTKLAAVTGNSSMAQSIISGALYIICTGANDFHLNYYFNPSLLTTLTFDQYCQRLLVIFNNTVTQLYDAGARRIGVVSLPPVGCYPAAITVFGLGGSGCVPWLNANAQRFNAKLSAAVGALSSSERHAGLKIALLDVYTPVYGLVTSPGSYGFVEARRGCCATGTVEFAVLCNAYAPGTCPDASQYVFWDAAHPTEAANQVIADYILAHGINDLVA